MDVFAEHGIAGMIGLFFNGLFGANYIIGLDGVNTGIINGGFPNHNWKQLYIQSAYIVAVTAYVFVVSTIICFAIDKIPGLHLRASEHAELLGMDDDQLGEFAYDYVEVRRDYLAWTPAKEHHDSSSPITAGDRHGIATHSQMVEMHEPPVATEERQPPALTEGREPPPTTGSLSAAENSAEVKKVQ
jgi:Amt family ammonium transporter